MTDNLISFENVSVLKQYKILLAEISFNIKRGDFLGIIGPNGAGKTTLLMTINGFISHSSGCIRIFDKIVDNNFNWNNARKKIGYLPQKPEIDLFFPITVEEVVLMGRIGTKKLFYDYDNKDKELVRKYINEMGLENLRKRPMGQLSGGEQQKVHLTRVLVQEPELILFDEPLTGLDLRWQQKISEIIEKIADDGKKGIIMVTHETQHLPPSCKKFALINKGKMSDVYERGKFFSGNRLSEVYGCKVGTFVQDGRIYTSPWGKDV